MKGVDMKKIFLGAVFGLTIMGSAGASIVSRGFFDEQIAEYAKSTELDLKANQRDFMSLVDTVGDVAGAATNLWGLWNDCASESILSMVDPNKHSMNVEGVIFNTSNVLRRVFDAFLIQGGEESCTRQPFLGLVDLTTKTNALETKIGTIPTAYKTIGEALSAIEGIAEEAKTLAEQAIPDPRSEGSNGKFVLTVDVIGENTTYHWEKIDRALDETQTTSE